MDKPRLHGLLDAETKAWAAKPYDQLVQELSDVAACGAPFHP